MRELTKSDRELINEAIQSCQNHSKYGGIDGESELKLKGGILAFIRVSGTYTLSTYADGRDEIESDIVAKVELRDEDENSLWLPCISYSSVDFC